MSIASRYAEALFDLGKEREKLTEISDSFAFLMTIFSENKEMVNLLSHPLIAQEDKKDSLSQLTEELEPEIRNLLMVLVDNKRERVLDDIYRSFTEFVRQEENKVLCEITTALSLEEEDLTEIRDALSGASEQKDVELETSVDDSIIGGLILQIGDRVYDYSLKGQLNKLREQLTKTTITS